MVTTINVIVILIAIASLAWGAYKGLTTQLVSILGLILGIWAAAKLTPAVAEGLQKIFGSSEASGIIKIVVYILLVILIIILCHFIGKLLDKVMKLTVLGTFNTILGAIFGLFKVLFILAVLASLINYSFEAMDLGGLEPLRKSEAFRLLLKIADFIFPFLKNLFIRA